MSWFEGNRKLIFAGVLLVIGGLAVVAKAIQWDQFMSFAEWIFAAYIVGNGIEHTARAIKKNDGPTS